MKSILQLGLVSLLSLVNGDLYLHMPRGSNNRLNENTANRQNANRVFDSQNNNKGGYNVGDKTDEKSRNDESKQFQLSYFQSSINAKKGSQNKGLSKVTVEWTSQHGCGGNEDDNPNKLNCNLVLQYMCQPWEGQFKKTDPIDLIRDGVTTNTQKYKKPAAKEILKSYQSRKKQVSQNLVLQEPMEWYDKCITRDRNKGLFTADQVLGDDGATNTRQNPNGQRSGYECPEERDYYPYWHPSDWKDIGVMAQNASMCEFYQKESFNVKARHECVENFGSSSTPKHYSKHNNEKACKAVNGQWLEFHNYLEIADGVNNENACKRKNTAAMKSANIRYIWARPMYSGVAKRCLVALDTPFCKEAEFSRTNHLGNGVDLEPLTATWVLPHFPSGNIQKCVLRMRYNISTDDYDPWNTTSRQNQDRQNGILSPVTQNPLIDVGADNIPLRLAINTAQFGRTFQDRSHTFYIKPRPVGVPDNANILNLSIRGKRGNIVQTYPAVEYDFVPTDLQLTTSDLVHIQWTGSNTHDNEGGGDGQPGDDGEGTPGTDRNNMVAMRDRLSNYPSVFEDTSNFFNNVEVMWADGHANVKQLKTDDIATAFASSGYYKCVRAATCNNDSLEKKVAMDKLLNNAPASYPGMLLRVTRKGTYNYMCTRNNNFSNRSQKGSIIVS